MTTATASEAASETAPQAEQVAARIYVFEGDCLRSPQGRHQILAVTDTDKVGQLALALSGEPERTEPAPERLGLLTFVITDAHDEPLRMLVFSGGDILRTDQGRWRLRHPRRLRDWLHQTSNPTTAA